MNMFTRSMIGVVALGTIGASAEAGPIAPINAYIIEGSGFFGAPGIELAQAGYLNLEDPSDVTHLPMAGDLLRFGGADIVPGGSDLIGFENTTNALRIIDTINGGNALIDSIGFMDSGVAGMAISNDGSITYVTTAAGAFVRIVQADTQTGEVLEVHNLLTNVLTSLAVVPEGHQILTPGDLYGLALTNGGGVRLVRIDLETNSITSDQFVSGVGFTAQFETGLDFAPDGTLYALIQGFDEVSPDVFVEISSHLFTIDTSTGAATDLGVVEGDQTWDAVTLVVDTAVESCPGDLTGDGNSDFLDISAFINAYTNDLPLADLNNDGNFDFLDISMFLQAYANGCP